MVPLPETTATKTETKEKEKPSAEKNMAFGHEWERCARDFSTTKMEIIRRSMLVLGLVPRQPLFDGCGFCISPLKKGSKGISKRPSDLVRVTIGRVKIPPAPFTKGEFFTRQSSLDVALGCVP
jgi:hypothetical protein